MFNVKLFSRHAVGTISKHGQYVAKAIDLYRKRLRSRVAAKSAVDEMKLCPPQICWASPGDQRMRRALSEVEEKTKVKVEQYPSQA